MVLQNRSVMFADTGSCGNTIELIQSVLWDPEISFSVLLSARCVVVYNLYLSYVHVCVSGRNSLCPNRVVPLQVHNVSFSFELMQDGGLERPKPRPEGRTHI